MRKMYQIGAQHALETLGFIKEAGRISQVLIKPFELMGPKAAGGFAGTAPFLAPLGGIAGGITGAATANEGERGRKALLGALLGMGLGGLAAGTHGAIRSHLSKVPTKLNIGHSSAAMNPEADEAFKRIFREAAGVAGAGGVASGAAAGLLGRKKD
jgi:hypothetical protein